VEALDASKVAQFLARTKVTEVSRDQFGRALTWRDSPLRTVVIYVGDKISREHLSRLVSVVLSSQGSWLLIPRWGPAAKIGLPSVPPDAEALVFGGAELEQLCTYLCTRNMDLRSASCDVYLVGASGTVFVIWDHHTSDEGLQLSLWDVDESSRLLAKLNTIGAELELFYDDADR
jgi:hypothetical protein